MTLCVATSATLRARLARLDKRGGQLLRNFVWELSRGYRAVGPASRRIPENAIGRDLPEGRANKYMECNANAALKPGSQDRGGVMHSPFDARLVIVTLGSVLLLCARQKKDNNTDEESIS